MSSGSMCFGFRTSVVSLACAITCVSGQACARPVDSAALTAGTDQLLTLDNGDVLKVHVISVTDGVALVEHSVFGQINVPLARIESTTLAPSPAQVQAAVDQAKAEAEAALIAPPPPPAVPEEAKLTFFQGWKSQVEGGLNGSDGNTETFSGRIGFGTKRVTDAMETAFKATYVYAEDSGEKSKSRGELDFRNDWIFKDSPWGFFAQGKLEYDEFQDWDWRLSAFAGPTYTVVKNDRTTFRLRAGAGATREFGGENNDIMPEALFGFDFAHKLTDAQSLFLNYEYLMDLEEPSQFRMNTKAGYEIMIDPKTQMSLKLGLEDRYNSDPGSGREKNDIDYFALIAWSF